VQNFPCSSPSEVNRRCQDDGYADPARINSSQICRACPISRRGYSAFDFEGIFHGNWVNFFSRSWKRKQIYDG
jgi:hypothetical protein